MRQSINLEEQSIHNSHRKYRDKRTYKEQCGQDALEDRTLHSPGAICAEGAGEWQHQIWDGQELESVLVKGQPDEHPIEPEKQQTGCCSRQPHLLDMQIHGKVSSDALTSAQRAELRAIRP